MGFYERRILPALIDFSMRQRPIMKQREKVVPRARGRVLEVGIGSGLNLSFYRPEQVERVWGLDPSVELQRRARERAARAGVEVEFIGLSGEEIPVESEFFDTVVVTYTLCSIPDVSRALGEMARVLKSGGRLLFSEHGIAPDPQVSRRQRSFDRWWPKIAGGCHLTRPVPALLRQAGFELEDLNAAYLPGPKPLTYNYWGAARIER
jgi:ubiquinone/menaquinone biosynthesis C-methylase UbiE